MNGRYWKFVFLSVIIYIINSVIVNLYCSGHEKDESVTSGYSSDDAHSESFSPQVPDYAPDEWKQFDELDKVKKDYQVKSGGAIQDKAYDSLQHGDIIVSSHPLEDDRVVIILKNGKKGFVLPYQVGKQKLSPLMYDDEDYKADLDAYYADKGAQVKAKQRLKHLIIDPEEKTVDDQKMVQKNSRIALRLINLSNLKGDFEDYYRFRYDVEGYAKQFKGQKLPSNWPELVSHIAKYGPIKDVPLRVSDPTTDKK